MWNAFALQNPMLPAWVLRRIMPFWLYEQKYDLRMREVAGLVCLAEVRRLLRDALSSRCRIVGKGSRPPGGRWEAKMVMGLKVLQCEDNLRNSFDQARIMFSLLGRVLHGNFLTHPRGQRRDPWVATLRLGLGQGEGSASEPCNSRQHAAGHWAPVGQMEAKEHSPCSPGTRRRAVRNPTLAIWRG